MCLPLWITSLMRNTQRLLLSKGPVINGYPSSFTADLLLYSLSWTIFLNCVSECFLIWIHLRGAFQTKTFILHDLFLLIGIDQPQSSVVFKGSHLLREYTYKKVLLWVVGLLRFYTPYTNGLVVPASFFSSLMKASNGFWQFFLSPIFGLKKQDL